MEWKQYKFKFLLHKRYFDLGYGLTNLFKYALLAMGIASRDVTSTAILAVLYGIGCYFVGMLWVKWDFYTLDIEVSNKFNMFVDEMRKSIKRKV